MDWMIIGGITIIVLIVSCSLLLSYATKDIRISKGDRKLNEWFTSKSFKDKMLIFEKHSKE